MACLLCRNAILPVIQIFSQEGKILNIAEIISKYFWLQPSESDSTVQRICKECWEAVERFHRFYQYIAEIHQYWDDKFISNICIEKDPLPDNLKAELNKNIEFIEETEPHNEHFFGQEEVKLEVNDLELLPKIEIIEKSSELSQRSLRASRRNKHQMPIAESIKKENSELHENDALDAIEQNTEKTEIKKRGRRKKSQEQQNESIKTDNNWNITTDKEDLNTSNISAYSDLEDLGKSEDLGTDDSSKSSSESDSAESMAVVPAEKYAVIPPRRPVLKPKKYSKRQKPKKPPKRKSREEIEKIKSEQLEYDRVILSFFEKLVCPLCNLLVRSYSEIHEHFRASHNKDRGYVNCCSRSFRERKKLAEHIYVHWNPQHFKCSECNTICHSSTALMNHAERHKSSNEQKIKKEFKCNLCTKTFGTKKGLEYHCDSRHVPKTEFKYQCEICNKKFATQPKLKVHNRYVHDAQSTVICDKCGKQMHTQSNLKRHYLFEHSDAPRELHECKICGQLLRSLNSLKDHVKVLHEETGEFICPICNKKSANSRALKRHIRFNHECERKFKCKFCEKAFKRPLDLKEHTSTHTGEALYKCPNCSMTFFSSANMYTHRQRVHRAEWEADRKKQHPPNIMAQASSATAALKSTQIKIE